MGVLVLVMLQLGVRCCAALARRTRRTHRTHTHIHPPLPLHQLHRHPPSLAPHTTPPFPPARPPPVPSPSPQTSPPLSQTPPQTPSHPPTPATQTSDSLRAPHRTSGSCNSLPPCPSANLATRRISRARVRPSRSLRGRAGGGWRSGSRFLRSSSPPRSSPGRPPRYRTPSSADTLPLTLFSGIHCRTYIPTAPNRSCSP